MAATFISIINRLSSKYAEWYAAGSADALSARFSKEIGLMAKAARSHAVTDWMQDETNPDKIAHAYEEMLGIVGELYSFNLYVGLEGSLVEYRIEEDGSTDEFRHFAELNKNNADDVWYFECIKSDADYLFSVGIDHVMHRKRVWLDYKVKCEGATLGVICTGLEFSHIVGELFAHYDANNMRGLVIDSTGSIHMDSSLMNNNDFLYEEYFTKIEDVCVDPAFRTAIRAYLDNNEGYAGMALSADPVKISSSPYRYMKIAPIEHTDWSIVILSGTPQLFNLSLFIPALMILAIILIIFAATAGAANYRLIFLPLGRLDRSLSLLKENNSMQIYGIERDDELGELSRTIQDLFNKANIDALTGIYNRRFMENNLAHIMEMLSRANGMLSALMLDIDNFKKYNDTYGHDRGDACLRAVARSIEGNVTRANDFIARYGGEEFIVVLPNTDEAGARVVAEKLLDGVRAMDIPHTGNAAAPCVTVSIGATTGRVSYKQHWEAYIKQADKALYMSKQNGRNRYTFLEFPDKVDL